jgi:transcriptional regulator with XRE-family HTH domain
LYGEAKLDEVVDKGTAILTVDISEPAASLCRFRNYHGLSIRELADQVGLTPSEVTDAENPTTRTSMRVLSCIATYFGIPPLELSCKKFYPGLTENASN